MAERPVAEIRAYFEELSGVGTGGDWYVAAFDADGKFIDDNQKIWFPITTEDYAQDEENELVAALEKQFPGAAIEVR